MRQSSWLRAGRAGILPTSFEVSQSVGSYLLHLGDALQYLSFPDKLGQGDQLPPLAPCNSETRTNGELHIGEHLLL